MFHSYAIPGDEATLPSHLRLRMVSHSFGLASLARGHEAMKSAWEAGKITVINALTTRLWH